MMPATTTPDMELALPARAANIAVVRHAFGALGEAFAVDEEILSNIRLAVTEACTNVVVHAYPDEREGLLEVAATLREDKLEVRRARRRPGNRTAHRTVPASVSGLPLIVSLTESVQLGRDEDERTEVRMTFPLSVASRDKCSASRGQPKPYGSRAEDRSSRRRRTPSPCAWRTGLWPLPCSVV